ncbi:MAG TPA: LysR substrate-binding domain-containing protein [Trebonia sp.]
MPIRHSSGKATSCTASSVAARAKCSTRAKLYSAAPGAEALIRELGLVCLARSGNPGFVALIDDYLEAIGLRPRVLQRAQNVQTVLALVTAGIGAALVSARAGAIAPGLRLLPVDHPAARWRIALAWQPRDPSPTLAAFVESARDIAGTSTATA